MTRLPVVDADNDGWGTVLNDFLGVSHNADGTLKTAASITYVDTYVTDPTNATAGINNAISALTAGGTLVFGGRRYTTAGGHVINKACRIVGPTGRGQTFNQSAQLYLQAAANADMFTITSADVVIRDLSLYGNEVNQSGTSRGIVTSTAGTNSYLELDSVWVDSFNGDGYSFESSGGTISGILTNCESRLNDGYGMKFLGTSTDMQINGGYIDQNVQSGVHIAAGDITFSNVHIWGNGTGVSGDRDGVTLQSSSGCRFENCYVEGNHAGAGIRFKTGTNQGHVINGCDIYDNGQQGIYAFSADNCIISSNIIRRNNFSGLTGANGAGMTIDTCTTLIIEGNQFFDVGTKRQTYGFFETGSSNSDIKFEGNISRAVDHATGGVSLGVGTLADLGSYFIRKIADQSVTSSTAIVDDTHLQFPVAAGEVWELEGVLFVDGAQTGDLNVRLATPGSPTGYWQALGPAASATSTTAVSVLPVGQLFDTTQTLGALGAGVITPIQLQGLYVVGTAGTFKVRWAQGTSDATATTLKAGSYLRARRIGQ